MLWALHEVTRSDHRSSETARISVVGAAGRGGGASTGGTGPEPDNASCSSPPWAGAVAVGDGRGAGPAEGAGASSLGNRRKTRMAAMRPAAPSR